MCLLSLRQLRWQRCQILLTCRYESSIDANDSFDMLVQEVRDKIVFERARMFGLLSEFDFLEPFTSESNFILCR
jgi:histidinol-phosphate/aromatic aminotransferase/cobyric acid decarboxylase-like protein